MTRLAQCILAPNPGPMTLEGTNSYIIAAPDAPATVIVDPGPLDEGHLAKLTARPVELVLITHHHSDHTEASAELHRRTGAPVRAADPAYCIQGDPLTDGELIEAGGTSIRVVATPGHTADSVCFELAEDRSMLTGDTILGRGTTVIIPPDGTLGDYLATLGRLGDFGSLTVLPGHGPELPDLSAIAGQYLEHRLARLDQVREVIAGLGRSVTVEDVAKAVYPEAHGDVKKAAQQSIRAQLDYLASE